MGVSSTSDDVDERGGADEAPTQALIAAAASDRCANCGSQLAADQRYCVSCGERRGKARFPVATMHSRQVVEERPVAAPPTRSRMSSGSTLVAGIGTLLLAMGVGVLIGRANTQPTQRASAPAQIITVGGNGGGTSTGPTTASTHHAKPPKAVTASQGKGKPPIFKKVVVTKQALTKANKNLSQVVPTQGLAPATVTTPGQSCSSGAGCQGGKFTGNFFGQ
jgi:hypothetical protein